MDVGSLGLSFGLFLTCFTFATADTKQTHGHRRRGDSHPRTSGGKFRVKGAVAPGVLQWVHQPARVVMASKPHNAILGQLRRRDRSGSPTMRGVTVTRNAGKRASRIQYDPLRPAGATRAVLFAAAIPCSRLIPLVAQSRFLLLAFGEHRARRVVPIRRVGNSSAGAAVPTPCWFTSRGGHAAPPRLPAAVDPASAESVI
jgi:hypothetical protein